MDLQQVTNRQRKINDWCFQSNRLSITITNNSIIDQINRVSLFETFAQFHFSCLSWFHCSQSKQVEMSMYEMTDELKKRMTPAEVVNLEVG